MKRKKFVSPLLVNKNLANQAGNNAANPAGPGNTTAPPPMAKDRVATAAQPSANTSSGTLADDAATPVPCFYFHVLWRKQTTKKNKTWNGDGVLQHQGATYTLFDMDGKDIGKTVNRSYGRLKEGEMIGVGQKEVEIGAVMKEEQFTSGRCFIAQNISTGSLLKNASATAAATFKKFKPPTLLANKGGANAGAVTAPVAPPQPRHSPDAENALVMKRPRSSGSQHGMGPIVDVVVDPLLTKHLRPHQREGVSFLYECVMKLKAYDGCGAILADEMGLGKTLQTITLVWTLLKQTPYGGNGGVAKRVLIVSPATLVLNWKKEFKKWLGEERIKVYAVTGNSQPSSQAKADVIKDFVLGSKIYPVCLISYERVRILAEELGKMSFDLIVCDEGHRLKSGQIKTALALKSLPCRRRLILSGTPVQNDLGEYYSMVDFVNPGILGPSNAFKKIFEETIMRSRQPGCTPQEKLLGEQREAELQRLTSLFVLRRTSEVNRSYLPPKSEIILFCRPSALQIRLYKHLLEHPSLAPLHQRYLAQTSSALTASDHLVFIGALRKLVNAPEILFESAERNEGVEEEGVYDGVLQMATQEERAEFHVETSGKMAVLAQLLKKVREQGRKEKVVVASNFTKTLDAMEKLCQQEAYSYVRLDGSTPSSKRMEYVDRFNRPESDTFLFLLSSKSGGTGLNLVGASRLFLFDVDWNPSNDLQVMARIWRDGQKAKQVQIYRLISTGTIEEKIYQRQIVKTSLSDALIDEKKGSGSNHFSVEELRDLFTLHEVTACQTHDLMKCKCCQEEKEDSADDIARILEVDLKDGDVEEDDGLPAMLPVVKKPKLVRNSKPRDDVSASSLQQSELAQQWIHWLPSKETGRKVKEFDTALSAYFEDCEGTSGPVSFLMIKHSATKDE